MSDRLEQAVSAQGNLVRLFEPRGIAFVGASESGAGYGSRIIRYCLDSGYEGDVALVNPRYPQLFGRPCHPSLREVPHAVDVVVAMVGPARMADLLAAARDRGVGYIIVIGELVESTASDREERLAAFRAMVDAGGPRVVGPVCVGVLAPPARLSMSISSALPLGLPQAGPIGLISQSGGIIGAVIDRARLSGAGFSAIVSSGGEFDLGVCDYLEHLIDDSATRAIAMYCEGVTDYPRFLALADRARTRDKPIVLLKAGRTDAGAKAALSHSGRIAGSREIEEAVLRRHGVVLADDIDDLHITAGVLARCRVKAGKGIAAASLSGGYSVVVGDALSRAGLPIAELSSETCERLRSEVAQPRPSNPLDAGARPTPGREALDIRAALDCFEADAGVGLTLYAETTFLNPETVVHQLSEFVARTSKPHITCWQAGPAMAGVVDALRASGVIVLRSLSETTAALRALYDWCSRREQELLPPALEHRVSLSQSAGLLESASTRKLLQTYGVSVVEEVVVGPSDDPASAARRVGFPVVLKGIASGIAHKTEHGLVRVGLNSPAELLESAREMKAKTGGLDGFSIQPYLNDGIEMIVGIRSDAAMGAVVVLGFGGVYAEAMADPAVEAAPLTLATAEEMIDRVDRKGVLRGYRTGKPYARESLVRLLVAAGNLAASQRRVAELDLNPVIVGPESAVAVDWLVVLR